MLDQNFPFETAALVVRTVYLYSALSSFVSQGIPVGLYKSY